MLLEQRCSLDGTEAVRDRYDSVVRIASNAGNRKVDRETPTAGWWLSSCLVVDISFAFVRLQACHTVAAIAKDLEAMPQTGNYGETP